MLVCPGELLIVCLRSILKAVSRRIQYFGRCPIQQIYVGSVFAKNAGVDDVTRCDATVQPVTSPGPSFPPLFPCETELLDGCSVINLASQIAGPLPRHSMIARTVSVLTTPPVLTGLECRHGLSRICGSPFWYVGEEARGAVKGEGDSLL